VKYHYNPTRTALALRDRLQFWLEQLIMRGAVYRLSVIAGAIGLITLLGGLAGTLVDKELADPLNAFWWAFLRLTDPGYLGDDEGVGRRVDSAVLTVLGYVVFMGALIAIMTQWLHETMRRPDGYSQPSGSAAGVRAARGRGVRLALQGRRRLYD
jgi:hypothetical protein